MTTPARSRTARKRDCGLARGAGELGDVGLGDRHEDVALARALGLRLAHELAEHAGDAALHGLEGLAREALVGLAQPAAERR